MTITANTKIAALLKEHPESLETIISISPMFNKLRNPVLRKLMAGRTSIGMASKIGGCSVEDFFRKLEPLGFTIDRNTGDKGENVTNEKPDRLKDLTPDKISELDVRPVIEMGGDPLNLILEKIKSLGPGMVLKLLNTFEPIPLILLLKKKHFHSYVEVIADNYVVTYFYQENVQSTELPVSVQGSADWDTILKQYEGRLTTIDVREMEMPRPMLTILGALDSLPTGNALFVYHKRIPIFLLPELADRKFDYRTKEISDSVVHMLIFKV
ncbi:MAG: DUF2249 domain-containing protein [Chitinophagaceae bacterium]|nr:DUF2249 domain-containing protein [Chitinophagaceae bacterium]